MCIYLYGDILGFRHQLQQLGAHELASRLRSALSTIEGEIESWQRRIELARGRNKRGPAIGRFFRWAGEGTLGAYFGFDTLVLYLADVTRDTLDMCLAEFLRLCSMAYVTLIVEHHLMLRGVVSIAENYVIDDQVLILENMARARQLETIQEWSGIVVDIADFDTMYWNAGTRAEDQIMRYSVPRKDGVHVMPVLTPVSKATVRMMNERGQSLRSCLAFLQDAIARGGVEADVLAKIRNTLQFLEAAKKEYEIGLERERVMGMNGAGTEFDVR